MNDVIDLDSRRKPKARQQRDDSNWFVESVEALTEELFRLDDRLNASESQEEFDMIMVEVTEARQLAHDFYDCYEKWLAHLPKPKLSPSSQACAPQKSIMNYVMLRGDVG